MENKILYSHKTRKTRIVLGIFVGLVITMYFFLLGMFTGLNLGKRRPSGLPGAARKRVLMISIDGFRYDYILRGHSPNLASLASSGYMSHLVPQFPSYTFPNHYSLVTGLYPETHGIVSNAFFDPTLQRFFYFTNATTTMHPDFWNAEPIWTTNQAQGGKSAVLYWPGSDVEIGGARPFLYKDFDDSKSGYERVDAMLEWLDSHESINLAMMYFTDVDHAGHVYGPDSVETKDAIKAVDRAIGDLLARLKERNIYDQFNMVIVSDHGMVRASDSKKIFIDQLIPGLAEMLVWADFGPVAALIPKAKQALRLYSKLKEAIRMHKLPIKLYTKRTMPSAYHYTRNTRIAPFVLEARKGWTIDTKAVEWHPKGLHGYGRAVREMDGIFIGHGDAFRHSTGPEFHSNLDVYPLVCNLLEIEPRAHNGTALLTMRAMRER